MRLLSAFNKLTFNMNLKKVSQGGISQLHPFVQKYFLGRLYLKKKKKKAMRNTEIPSLESC